ncbi:MAG TPA: DUF1361 domain-containing protein [Chitinophagaceae bacterium]|jgi:uncharacterized membrane protein|nr:DUF1361 domain-containing protein [Chitinophagaceae bacterium]
MIRNLSIRPLVRQLYATRSEAEKALILSCAFSTALITIRILYTGSNSFRFLLWNLFLAFLPYALSGWMARKPSVVTSRWKFTAAFAAWFLFLPNSFYIITDLFHLGGDGPTPLWFDTAMILSFAWNGLVLGVLSVRGMEKLVAIRWNLHSPWLFLYPLMGLNAFGIYIGRYLRYNSWDVITNPFALVHDLADMALHPARYKPDWGMILCFTLLMITFYNTLRRVSRAVF